MRLWFWKIWLGPNFLGPLRYLLPYNKRFHIAARYHDIAYWRWWTESQKQKIDLMFYNLMVANSKNFFHLTFAKIYYTIVYKYWFIFFKYNYTWRQY